LGLVRASLTAACDAQLGGMDVCAQSPGALYEQRIAPLLHADHPNVCAQCHAGGSVDLASFLRHDACESMACLKDRGLVNLERPESSVLLSWIERAEPESELITEKVISEERAGFLEWIEHEAACGACAATVCPEASAPRCDEVDTVTSFTAASDPGDCGRETLEKLFRGTIYPTHLRCSPCHLEGTAGNEDAPRWATEIGSCEVAALATQQNVIDMGLVDVEAPEESWLLLKPLGEHGGGLPHGGASKFVKGDADYQAYLYWLSRYGACRASE
jgi:hypothetical protein